jgi:hypothetical protein
MMFDILMLMITQSSKVKLIQQSTHSNFKLRLTLVYYLTQYDYITPSLKRWGFLFPYKLIYFCIFIDMNREIINKMFSAFFKKQTLINGLDAKFINVNDDLIFYFDVKILDEVSYQKSVVINYIYDIVYEFFKIIGYTDIDYDIIIEGELKESNIGDDIKNGVEVIFSNIRTVLMKERDEVVKVGVQHVNSTVEIENNQTRVVNYVKPISGELCVKVNDVECLTVDTELAVKKFLEIRNNRIYDDSDYNYLDIDEFIDKYKLFSDGNDVIYTVTVFI